MVIYRLILRIFGDFQNFQISRFQIPENMEILWKLLFLTNCNKLGTFPTQYWSLSSVFHSEFLNHHFPGISRFQIPENKEMAIFDKLQYIGYFFHLVLITEFDFSLRIFKFLFSLNFLMSKTAILRFPEMWNLEIPEK